MEKENIVKEYDLALGGIVEELYTLNDSIEDFERRKELSVLQDNILMSKYMFIQMFDDAKERKEKEDLDNNK